MAECVRGSAAVRSVACFLAMAVVPFAACADAAWSLRLPKEEAVMYRGVVNFDSAGSRGGAFLYPAAGAAGLLAAVITHGILVESQKASQKNAMQESADRVLTPYRGVLDGFKHRELMQKALDKAGWGTARKLIEPSEARGSEWIVESQPTFFMTQDHRALVLDNAVSVHRPGAAAAHQATVRVVSQPRTVEDPQLVWTEGEGAELKDESASLLAHSLELALRDAAAVAAAGDAGFKTIRYREGEAEKMERAQVVSQGCQRQVLRTLRGWLMSVPHPLRDEPAPASCEPSLRGWK